MAVINYSYIGLSRVNGPGLRAVIWTQGCPHRCSGCFNPELWSSHYEHLASVSHVVSEIKRFKDIEGVTISGGEPLAQSRAIFELVREIKRASLTVMCYTGYTYQEVITNHARRKAVRRCDILVTGRFIKSLPQKHPWAGSGNQEVMFLSKAYSEKSVPEKLEVEVTIRNGEVIMTGFPRREKYDNR